MAETRLPSWAAKPFAEFLTVIEKLHEVLHLSMDAIARLRVLPGFERSMAHAREVLAENPDLSDVVLPAPESTLEPPPTAKP
jgi:hypothetical protein